MFCRMLEKVLDGECIELLGNETKIVSNSDTELDSTASASNKVAVWHETRYYQFPYFFWSIHKW